MTKTTTNTQSFYSAMQTEDDHLFNDGHIQRFDADTIKNRYGENWKKFASNVREVTQPDGSIVKEYIIEDPSLLEEIKASSRPVDSLSSTMISDHDQQQQQPPLKNKFAQLKAKFEQQNFSNVLASPATSIAHSSNTSTARQNSRKQMDDLYARHRRASDESIPINKINNENKTSIGSSNQSTLTQNSYHRSQSIGSETSKNSSFRRFNSADEADEEVSRIHRQGEELRRQMQALNPLSSSSSNDIPQQTRTQYEILDEDGNPMIMNNVQDLIKMSGARAREVPQPDGTVIKEYVIDDPQLLSQFRSQQQQQQQQQQSPMTSSYFQQQDYNQDAQPPPPPPPRIPLRPPTLFRQGGSSKNDTFPYNIQQIRVLEPQRRYEYSTTTGRRVEFCITNSNNSNGQFITDSDLRELTHAINLRLQPTSVPIVQQYSQQHQPQSSIQPPFNLPKQWYPAVDLTQRQRTGSDSQQYSNNGNIAFGQIQSNLSRSASSGLLDQGSYLSQNQQQVFNEPINNWNTSRHQDSHKQRYQNNETFQTSAQFLPQQTSRSTYSSPVSNNHHSSYHQSSTAYPYQGQQQHGVRILNDFNQPRTAVINDEHTRI